MQAKNSSITSTTQLILSAAIIFSLAFSAGAQTSDISKIENEAESKLAGISFPIAELNNCSSKEECKTFCNEPDNFKACFAFAKKHRLIKEVKEQSDDEIEKFAEAMRIGGPGGCKTPNECRAYCDDTNNIEQCVAFAEKNNLIPEEELAKAKQVVAAVKAGAKFPPKCSNREQCEAFCNATPENMQQCVDFAQKAGFMKPEEAEHAKKMAEVMRSGQTPGNCKGHEECETYCHNQENFTECRAFAEKMGFAEEGGRQRMEGQMMGEAMRGPGSCEGKEACEAYCLLENHQEECQAFSG